MICCLLQIASLVKGIAVLSSGELPMGKRVVIGHHARLLGGIMVAWLPIVIAVSMLLGVLTALNDPQAARRDPLQNLPVYLVTELVIDGLVFVVFLGVAIEAPKYDRKRVRNGRLVSPRRRKPRADGFNPSMIHCPSCRHPRSITDATTLGETVTCLACGDRYSLKRPAQSVARPTLSSSDQSCCPECGYRMQYTTTTICVNCGHDKGA